MKASRGAAGGRWWRRCGSDKALFSVKMLDQHRVVKELVGPTLNLADLKRCCRSGRARRAHLEGWGKTWSEGFRGYNED